jgi:hypothetical protein
VLSFVCRLDELVSQEVQTRTQYGPFDNQFGFNF